MQFVSRERRSSIVGTMIERKRERGREISLKTRSHRRVATPLDGWLHLGENAIWNSAHFPVCRSSSRFRGSLPNVRTRKYLPLIKFTPRNVPTSLPLSHDATLAAIQLLSLLVASTSTHSSPTSLVCARALTLPLYRTPSLTRSGREKKRNRQHFIDCRSWIILFYARKE